MPLMPIPTLQECRAWFDPPKCTSVWYMGKGQLRIFFEVEFWCAGSCPEEGEVCPPTRQKFVGEFELNVVIQGSNNSIRDLIDFTDPKVKECWDTCTAMGGSAHDKWACFKRCLLDGGKSTCDMLNKTALDKATAGIHRLNGEWGEENCNCGQVKPVPAEQVIKGLLTPNRGI